MGQRHSIEKSYMTEALPLWHDTPSTQAILDFVAAVTDGNNPHYIPPAERIAAFDNDGTLWCEKPTYISRPEVMALYQEGEECGKRLNSSCV